MKSFTIDIHPALQAVTFSVKNGREFKDAILKGNYSRFNISVSEDDITRVKKFAVKYGNDKNSNRGHWYAHCNGYAMDLVIDYKGMGSLNTYRPYGKAEKTY